MLKPHIRLQFLRLGAPPQGEDAGDACAFRALHIVLAVADIDGVLRLTIKPVQTLEQCVRCRLGMLHIIRADNFIEPRRETDGLDSLLQLQACPRGDNAALTAGVPQFVYHLGNAVVHRDFVQTVVRQLLPAGHDRLDLLGGNAQFGKCASARHTEGENQLLIGEVVAELGKRSTHCPLVHLRGVDERAVNVKNETFHVVSSIFFAKVTSPRV